MLTWPDHGESAKPHPRACRTIALEEVDNAVLLEGLSLWRGLSAGGRYPARSDLSARALKTLLRNTILVKVVDGGRDYEYRVVGDAVVMAHGASFQGKLWSETADMIPGYHKFSKPVYDAVVRGGEPLASRGWIERGLGSKGQVYCEYVYLPLGDKSGVDHILIFAVYLRRDGIDHAAPALTGSFLG